MSDNLIQSPLAIVGMACRLPGADDLQQYWQLLRDGRDPIGQLPPERLDRSLYYDPRKGIRGKTYSAIGGLIQNRPLDANLVGLRQDELAQFDPCHQILCETVAHAFLDAGYDPRRLPHRNAGVYVGHSGGSPRGGELAFASLAEQTADYLRDTSGFASLPEDLQQQLPAALAARLRAGRPQRTPQGGPELEAFMAAGLLARVFHLDGPQMTIDAACASSLAALALAATALQSGRIEMAVVGGASFNKADSLILFSQAQSCSAAGSRPFDARADGLISSEGYVALVVKTLERAAADGDRVHAVLRGLGFSSDGRGRSLWAPRKEGQVEAMRRAYEGRLDPRQVQYIEAHATSTQVGDATELEALADFFGKTHSDRKIPIGSVKSNIGHTLETAGLASLVKVVLAMQHGFVPPTLHVEQRNQAFAWETSPLEVATQLRPWRRGESGGPRRAAVNAFGIGGVNVHLVVDEFVERPAPQESSSPLTRPPLTNGTAASENGRARRPIKSVGPGEEAIAVVGRGVILPHAFSVSALDELVRSGATALSEAPPERWRGRLGVQGGAVQPWHAPSCRGGFVRDYHYDWKRHKIAPKQIERANPLQFMLLDAAAQALREAGYEERPLDRHRAAVVIGNIFGGEFGNQLHVGLRLPEIKQQLSEELLRRGVPAGARGLLCEQYEKLLLRAKPALLDETGSFTSSTLATRIAKTLDLMGGALAIDAGEASSFAALEAACDLLRCGSSSLVLCGAAQRAMDLPAFELLSLRGRLAGSQADAAAHPGYLPGEGVVVLALKRLGDAERDGDRTLAVVRGLGVASGGSGALESAATRALFSCGEPVERIEQVCADDVAGSDGRQALRTVYQKEPERLPLVDQIGHTQAAHGLVALTWATLQATGLPRKRLIGLSTQGTSRLAQHLLLEVPAIPVSPGMRQYSACAASDAADLSPPLAADKPVPVPVAPQPLAPPPRIVRLGGRTPTGLAERVAQAQTQASETFFAEKHSFARDETARLAVVASDPAALAEKLGRALRDRQKAESHAGLHEQGIFFGEVKIERPRLAFLFPGQGAQYVGMLQPLLDASPAARARLVEADAILRRLGSPPFAQLAWHDPNRLGDDIWTTQAAVLLADLFYYEAIVEQGIRPTYVSGHSFGEFAALVAAGSWTLEQALRLTRSRTDAIIAQKLPPTAMLAVNAEPEKVAALLGQRREQLFLTHHNAPQKTVVAGTRAAVDAFAKVVTAEGWGVKRLAVPCAFHTPLLEGAQEPWRRALAGEPLLPPGMPLLSNVGNRFLAEPEEIRGSLAAQLTEPVRYAPLVERLYASGAQVFIEVGPQQILTSFHRRILAQRDAICLATDSSSRPWGEQVLHLQAALESLGLDPSQSQRAATASGAPAASAIEHFDATARRRNRRRAEAQQPRPPAESSPQTPPTNAPATQAPHSSPDVEALGQFLVDFVVEQTGYPPEIVELDADLEADLGIDSIKKAQLLGELSERVALGAPGQMRLGALRTLRHILALATERQSASQQSGMAPPVSNAFAVEPSRARHADAEPCAPKPTGEVAARQELAQFLVDFVVEQTGYPPEIVELDADLEADLGIDSIKKAQLLGELCERYGIETSGKGQLVLSRHRTLRDVMTFLDEQRGVATETGFASTVPQNRSDTAPAQNESYARGLERGRREKQQIRTLLRELVETPAEPVANAELSAAWQDRLPEAEMQELQGIADGAAVHVASLIASRLRAPRRPAASDLTQAPAPPDSSSTAEGGKQPSVPDREAARDERIATRYILRTAAAPSRAGGPTEPRFSGAAIILGQNPVAEALQDQLQQSGVTTYPIDVTDDPAEAVQSLTRIWDRVRAPHLFITTPLDADAATTLDGPNWKRRRSRGILTPFWVCQRWLQLVQKAGLMDEASLVGLTALGGSFGFAGEVVSAESGALAGLLKAVLIESWVAGFRTTPIKLIDSAPGQAPHEVVQAVWRELAVPTYDMEISWANGQRRAVRAIAQPIQPPAKRPLPHGGVWVCTGGGRGVTAYAARELAARYGLKLHLLGTAPPPQLPDAWRSLSPPQRRELQAEVMRAARAADRSPIQAWRDVEKALEIDDTLREMKAAGIAATYHQCDVADRIALREVLERIRRTDGAIEGVLHGAGVGQDARFEHKRPEKVEQCIRAKVDGALALMELTADDPLQYFVAFGSISGRFGANGHADYSLANEMLAKQVAWYRAQRPEVAAVAFHWHAWGDVGMAARPDTRLALQMIDMQFMPAHEGVVHLIDELEAGAPEAEVLITDERYYRAFYPAETLSSATDERSQPGQGSLLAGGETEQRGAWQTTTLHLDPTAEPFLRAHRLEDDALLPVVVGLELLAEAAARRSGGKTVTALRDLRALCGLRFREDRPQTVRVRVAPDGKDFFTGELVADVHTRDGRLVERGRLYLTGRAECGETASAPPLPQVPEGAWQAVQYAPRGAPFYVGPPLRCLRKVKLARGRLWGQVVAPALGELAGPKRSTAGWIVPSAALDACLYGAGLLAWEQVAPGVALPTMIEHLRLGRLPQPGEPCLLEVRLRSQQKRQAAFDFILWGDNGELILHATGYRVTWLAQDAPSPPTSP